MNILVTGGASGLGEAITRVMAKDINNTIYFTYSSSKSNAESIEAEFRNAYPIKCDFRVPGEVKSLTDEMGRFDLDVLINNAYSGEFLKSHFHKTATNDFLTDFQENIIPTIAITQSAITGFRKKRKGKIITILTAALLNVPPIGSSVYVANKAYLEKLTKVWASENSKFNITSNSISPSFMKTKLTANLDERLVEQIGNAHPMKEILTIQEVAESAAYLVYATSQINGVDLVLNAGVNIK